MVTKGNPDMGKVVVEVVVTNNADRLFAEAGYISADKVRQMRVSGIVDTGAAMLVLPESVAKQLGLPKTGETKVRYADHRTATREIVGQVEVEYYGRRSVFDAVVEPGRPTALIGAIVMEALDLIVDCKHQTLTPRDPDQILTEIE
jgi:predicted aspartyl protease